MILQRTEVLIGQGVSGIVYRAQRDPAREPGGHHPGADGGGARWRECGRGAGNDRLMGSEVVNVGVIGGGLMGREGGECFRALVRDHRQHGQAEADGGCGSEPRTRWDGSSAMPEPPRLSQDHRALLEGRRLDRCRVRRGAAQFARADLPRRAGRRGRICWLRSRFGIDLGSAERIAAAGENSGRFVRCSSEFPFFSRRPAGLRGGSFWQDRAHPRGARWLPPQQRSRP